MHIGKGNTPSKTEAMYFPAPKQQQRPEDTANFDVAAGFVFFTQEFRDLGSIIHSSLRSDVYVNTRIKKKLSIDKFINDIRSR